MSCVCVILFNDQNPMRFYCKTNQYFTMLKHEPSDPVTALRCAVRVSTAKFWEPSPSRRLRTRTPTPSGTPTAWETTRSTTPLCLRGQTRRGCGGSSSRSCQNSSSSARTYRTVQGENHFKITYFPYTESLGGCRQDKFLQLKKLCMIVYPIAQSPQIQAPAEASRIQADRGQQD